MRTATILFFPVLFLTLLFTSCEQQNDELPPTEVELQESLTTYFALKGNTVRDLEFPPQSIQPRTTSFGSFSLPIDGVEGVAYKGAVAPSAKPWYAIWSFYDRVIHGGMSLPIDDLPKEVISDNGEGTGTTTWTSDKIWVLDGVVFVNRGDVLTIEPGTIIQGREGSGKDASALVVARGAKIIADGDKSNPIIFTFEGDQGETDPTVRGKWGGVIVLGDASINTDIATNSIEGLSPADIRAYYGGSNDNDNSGILRYVSIRHGGADFGIPDNEINGLTLGGVGDGTIIENVEVIGNLDDGFEWFGGTVNCKNIIAAYCGDDALDYDLGYRGINQFIIIQQDESIGDRGGEHDGGNNAMDLPYSTPIFYNVTSIGRPASKAVTFRDNAGGEYHNSIFMNYGEGIDIEYNKNSQFHSFRQFQSGNLKIENNIFYNIQSGTLPQDLLKASIK